MNDIATRLKERREAAGLSQGQVVQYEDISQGYLSDIERGRNEPAVWSLLARLVKRYRTSADYILGITDDPTPAETRDLPDVVRELLIIALQLSNRRQTESLRIMQTLLALEEQERTAITEELKTVANTLLAEDTAGQGAATARLLRMINALSGVDTEDLLVQDQSSGSGRE